MRAEYLQVFTSQQAQHRVALALARRPPTAAKPAPPEAVVCVFIVTLLRITSAYRVSQRAVERTRRNLEVHRLRSGLIDYQLKFRRTLHGHLTRLLPTKDAVHVNEQLVDINPKVNPVRHQSAVLSKVAVRVHCGKLMQGCKGEAVLAVVAEILGPLTLIIGLWPRWTALVLAVLTLLKIATTYRSGLWGAVFLPRRNVELYRNLAILGGLLFYFVSGPGAWSLGRGTRGAHSCCPPAHDQFGKVALEAGFRSVRRFHLFSARFTDDLQPMCAAASQGIRSAAWAALGPDRTAIEVAPPMLDPKMFTTFVTGATSGIGEATCRRFVSAGAKVIATGRRADRSGLKRRSSVSTSFSAIARHERTPARPIVSRNCSLAGPSAEVTGSRQMRRVRPPQ